MMQLELELKKVEFQFQIDNRRLGVEYQLMYWSIWQHHTDTDIQFLFGFVAKQL